MLGQLKEYDRYCDAFGLPQKYKGVLIYPVKLKDRRIYDKLGLLTINKEITKDESIRKLRYLKYLILTHLVTKEDTNDIILEELQSILNYVFQHKVGILYQLEKNFPFEPIEEFSDHYIRTDEDLKNLSFHIKVEDVILSEKDFDGVIKTIIRQNYIQTDTLGITDEKLYNKLESMLEKQSAKSTAGEIDEQIISYHILTGISYEEIYNYTFYQLLVGMERAELLLSHKIYSPLEKSGQISFKDEKDSVKHWLEHIEPRGRYDSIIVSADKMVNKWRSDLGAK